MNKGLKLTDFISFGILIIGSFGALVIGIFAVIGSSNIYVTGASPVMGKFIAPLVFLGAFALLANGLLYLDPDREKTSIKTVGVITATAGIMWWPFLIVMMTGQKMGPLTNFATGLAGMYTFFFVATGIVEIFDLPKKPLGPVAMIIGWLTLAYGIFFVFAPKPTETDSWIYHFSITFVWFVGMNAAGLMLQGKLREKLAGWLITLSALYTFAIPALLWSIPPGMREPF